MHYKGSSIYILLGFCFSVKILAQTRPSYFITAPNVFRHDVEESVVISVYNVNNAVTVQVYLQEYGSPSIRFSEVEITVSADRPVKVNVTVTPDHTMPNEEGTEYVYLVARSSSPELTFEKQAVVLVSPNNGQVFIQTDKPIYTPKQTVKIKLMNVDSKLRPNSSPLRIDIVNPQGTTVDRESELSTETGFLEKQFTFPSLPMFGNWSVVANYGRNYRYSEKVKFEVKEYVLPTFSVKVKTPEFILNKTDVIPVNVSAQYVYGKNVTGPVTLRFGIKYNNEVKLFGSKTGTLSSDIAYRTTFSTQEIKNLGSDFWFVEGSRLFVEATVTEQESGIKQKTESLETMFVSSPYKLKFTRSAKYFKPGLPYEVKVDVLHINGKPADNIRLRIIPSFQSGLSDPLVRGTAILVTTNSMGKAKGAIEVPSDTTRVEVEVSTETESPSSGELTVQAAVSPSDSFLVLQVINEHELKVSKTATVKVLSTEPGDIRALTLLAVTQGNIVYKQTFTTLRGTLPVPVNLNMVPSVRFVVYYEHDDEVVADSMLYEVKVQCRNKVTVKTASPQYTPGYIDTFEVSADPRTRVSVLAVDQAVYLLNNNDRLTPQKMFNSLRKYDTGCGVGSGLNVDDVFRNAGLTLLSNSNVDGMERHEITCDDDLLNTQRRRRSALPIPVRMWSDGHCCSIGRERRQGSCIKRIGRELIHVTASCRQAFLKCCKSNEGLHGVQDNLKPSFSNIESRIGGNAEPENSEEMAYTFEDIPDLREVIDDIPARHNFDETWIFREVETNEHGIASFDMTVPDSITTWIVQGVGINRDTGMCVSEPTQTKVFKDVFVQLELPYSVIRQEQIEVKATIFNYGTRDLQIAVHIEVPEKICATFQPGDPSERKLLTLRRNNSTTVSFPVVPMDIGEYPIKVIVNSRIQNARDMVIKDLNVIPEGVPTIDVLSRVLDPSGELRLVSPGVAAGIISGTRRRRDVQVDTVSLCPPRNAVPDSSQSTLSAIGSVMGTSVRAAIEGIENMLQLPTGCGEQTMLKMAPTTYAALYLKNTGQLTEEWREKAVKFIKSGYLNEQTFRKEDGSYSIWVNFPSSTWLTAFVTKVFCESQEFIYIEDSIVCDAMQYLANSQRQDGTFIERQPIIHTQLGGDIADNVTLTSFIVISMLECHCESSEFVESAKSRALQYLERHLSSVQDSYAMALIAYALKLANNVKQTEAFEKLKDMHHYNEVNNQRWWSRQDAGDVTALDVETTSYALLTSLLHEDMSYARGIVSFLTANRGSNGSFKSTQDTVVALQALSEYSTKTEGDRELELHSLVTSENSEGYEEEIEEYQEEISITNSNALVEQNLAIPSGIKSISIETRGQGTGQLTVELQYNTFSNTTLCQFELTASTRKLQFEEILRLGQVDFCDPVLGGSDMTGIVSRLAIHPVPDDSIRRSSRFGGQLINRELEDTLDTRSSSYSLLREEASISFSSLRSYMRSLFPSSRDGESDPPVEEAVDEAIPSMQRSARMSSISIQVVKVCASKMGNRDAGLSILEIGLFTGFEPIPEILEKLVKCNSTTFVSMYEINERTVTLHMTKIPHDHEICVEVYMKQRQAAGNIQPVPVKVYEYYEPGSMCIQFYGPEAGSELLSYICDKPTGQCVCAAGKCAKCYNVNINRRQRLPYPTVEEHLPLGMSRISDLVDQVCERSEYAYKIQVLSIQETVSFSVIEAEILKVIREGYESVSGGTVAEFWMRKSCMNTCKNRIEEGNKYLITGHEGIMYTDENTGVTRPKYVITERCYLVAWNEPNQGNRKEKRHASRLSRLQRRLRTRQCSNDWSYSMARSRFP